MATLKDVLRKRQNLDENIDQEFNKYQKAVKNFNKKKILSFVRQLKDLKIGTSAKLIALASALELADRYEKET